MAVVLGEWRTGEIHPEDLIACYGSEAMSGTETSAPIPPKTLRNRLKVMSALNPVHVEGECRGTITYRCYAEGLRQYEIDIVFTDARGTFRVTEVRTINAAE